MVWVTWISVGWYGNEMFWLRSLCALPHIFIYKFGMIFKLPSLKSEISLSILWECDRYLKEPLDQVWWNSMSKFQYKISVKLSRVAPCFFLLAILRGYCSIRSLIHDKKQHRFFDAIILLYSEGFLLRAFHLTSLIKLDLWLHPPFISSVVK